MSVTVDLSAKPISTGGSGSAVSSPTRDEKLSGPKLEGKALVEALRAQLDWYFNPTNLAKDTHLLQQMNAQKYVSVDVIASFKRIKQLTDDRVVLVEALRLCKNCALDDAGAMVRPALQNPARTTMFIRDVPSTTPVADIRALVEADTSPGKGHVVSIRPEFGDSWFVTFDSAEICQKTAMVLGLGGKTFLGKPIRCGVKSENLMRGFLSSQPNAHHAAAAQAQQQQHATGSITTPLGPNAAGGYGYNNAQAPYYYNPYYVQPQQLQQQQFASPAKGGQQQAQSGAAGASPNRKKKGRNNANNQPNQANAQQPAATPAAAAPKAGQTKSAKAAARNHNQQNAAKPQTPVQTGMAGPTDAPRKSTHVYSKVEMHDIIKAFQQTPEGSSRPSTMPIGSSLAIRSNQITECRLLDAIPLIIPASPSPALNAQVARTNAGPPLLDLNSAAGSAAAAAGGSNSARGNAQPNGTKSARAPTAAAGAPPKPAAAAGAPGTGRRKQPKPAAGATATAKPNAAAAAGAKPPLRPAGGSPALGPTAPAKPVNSTAYAARLGSKVGQAPSSPAPAAKSTAGTAQLNASGAAALLAAATGATPTTPTGSSQPAAATPSSLAPGSGAAAAPKSAPTSPAKRERGNKQQTANTQLPASTATAAATPASPAKPGKMSWADMAKRAQKPAATTAPAAAAAAAPAS